jgi:hypothetical protein
MQLDFFLYCNVIILSVVGFIMTNVEWLRSLSLVTLTSGRIHKELSKSVEVFFLFSSV